MTTYDLAAGRLGVKPRIEQSQLDEGMARERALERQLNACEEDNQRLRDEKARLERQNGALVTRAQEGSDAHGVTAQRLMEETSGRALDCAMKNAQIAALTEENARLHALIAIDRPSETPQILDAINAALVREIPKGAPLPAFELSFTRDKNGRITSPVTATPRG